MGRGTVIIRALALALFCLLGAGATAAAQEHKVALVIGNGAYRAHDRLESAGVDSAAVAKALRALRFEVIEQTDLGNGAFRAALNLFSEKLRPGGIALFYYTGYAVQVDGRNFLLPVRSELRRATDTITRAISLNAVLHIMDRARSRVNAVLLDASYPDRVSAVQSWSDPGLAAPGDAGGNSLIVLSAWPGSEIPPQIGGSFFAQELVAALAGPRPELVSVANRVKRGVEARSRGAQQPWIGPGFADRVALGREALQAEPEAGTEEPAADQFAAAGAATGEQELVRHAARPAPTVRPPPAKAPDAKAKPEDKKTLSQVAGEAVQKESPAGTEYERTLSPRDRGQIQRDLETLGLYRGGADRIFGPGTRSGIRKLQRALSEATTGVLTAAQRTALAARAAERRKADQAGRAAAAKAAARQAQAERPATTDSSKPPASNAGQSKARQTTVGDSRTKAPSQAAENQGQAPVQQAAAPSNLPFGTTQEAESFLKNQANIKETLQRYNSTKFIVEHEGTFKIAYIDSLRVTQVEGDRITARIKFTVAARRQNSNSGTFDFVLKWSDGAVEILSHARR